MSTATTNGASNGAAPKDEPVEKKEPNGTVDAGLKSLEHYKRALPRWRYRLRQRLLPIVRWETPHLARLQRALRTPALDYYFAWTANLGTHTFFMIMLPVLFWCGEPAYGKGIVHILATGVFFTGFIKDMFSLPRPLSPPLHRITMSGSAALEYGFPSTHSANAVSVAVYSLLKLREHSAAFSPSTALALEVLAYFYAVSIVFGRLYCGMHGFLDVITGSALGALISLIEFHCAPWIEEWLQSSSYLAPLTIVLFILLFVRIHPEPADDCPCFDDSVSFAGVMIGLELGTWRFARYSPLAPVYVGTNPTFDLSALTWPVALGRIVLGIAVIVSWREVMKPTLLKLLPHLYRVFETYGLSLPRKFFTPASKYKDVPLRGLKDDNVLPHVADVAKAVKSIRGPGRGRAVSVGPQSAADAYETLAWRERKRRESLSRERNALKSKKSVGGLQKGEQQVECRQVSGVRSGGRKEEFEQGEVVEVVSEGELELEEEEELLDEKDVFSRVVKPRVRYDVEVVTKLVVYAGIGWLSVDPILILFELIGLGTGQYPGLNLR